MERTQLHLLGRVAAAMIPGLLLCFTSVPLVQADVDEPAKIIQSLTEMLIDEDFEKCLKTAREVNKTTTLSNDEQARIAMLSWHALLGLEQEGNALRQAREALQSGDSMAYMALDFLTSYHFDAGEYEKILELAETSRTSPRTPKMEIAWGSSSMKALTRLGLVDETIEKMRDLSGLYGEAEGLVQVATTDLWLARHNLGDKEGAAEILDAAAMYFPSLRKNPQFLNNQGAVHYELENDKIAEISYLQALAQAETPEHKAISYFGLANSAYRTQRFEQALQYLDKLDQFANVTLDGVEFFDQSLILRELVESEMELSPGIDGTIPEKAVCWIDCSPPPIDECRLCCSSNNQTSVLNLEGSGSPLEVVDSTVTLSNLEPGPVEADGTQVRYLVEEWAVFSIKRGRSPSGLDVRALNASSQAIVNAKMADLRSNPASLAAVANGSRTVLVVEAAKHPDNSRSTAIPEVALKSIRPDFDLPNGTLLLRGFYGPDHRLEKINVLHAFDGFPSVESVPDELLDFLRQGLVLEAPTSDTHKHPVVAFVVLRIRGGKLRIMDTERFLPRCCCGNIFCI